MTDSTPRLPENFKGSISEGTMHPRDLVPKFVSTLAYVWPTHELCERYHVHGTALQLLGEFLGRTPLELADDLDFWECESMGYLLNDLFDALNEVAPTGTYFGASEGDGASYGFWDAEQDED